MRRRVMRARGALRAATRGWRTVPMLAIAAVWAVLAVPAGARAQEPCEAGAGVGVSGTPRLDFHDAYSPFAPADLIETTTLMLANRSPAVCELSVIFTTPSGAGALTSGAGAIAYTLETPGGAALLRPSSTIDPEAGSRFDLTLNPGEAAALSLRARIPAGQISAPGGYADTTVQLRIYRRPGDGDFGALLVEQGFVVSAAVASVCTMSEPQPASIDFSDDIGADGRPGGAARTVQLHQATCNTAARIRLRGAPLARTDNAALPGSDSFIGLEAQAGFGSLGALLEATQAGQAADAVSGPSQGTLSAPVDLTLRLLAGRALAAGHYSGVLTIMLEPLH